MNFQNFNKALATIVATFAFVGSGYCQALVKIDGSSTVFPITEVAAEEFQIAHKGKFRVTVGISGTGGGFKKFCRGETDFQNASRPISALEMSACKAAGVSYIEFPIAYDAITVVVNTKSPVNEISMDELKTIWAPEAQGKIKKWNQVRKGWPDANLNLFGAGADSGTFDYFSEAVNGKAKASRGDYTASEDDNTLVTGVSRDVNALGFLPFSYYELNKKKLKALAIIGGPKAPVKTGVLPSYENVESGKYFPLSRPLFVYVNSKALEREEVRGFVEFYLAGVSSFAKTVRYIPLPAAAYKKNEASYKSKRLGTVFGGKEAIGMKIEELMKREAAL